MATRKALLIAVILAVSLLVFGGCKAKVDGGHGREVAALVNGERIYIDDVNTEYNMLAPSQKQTITKSDALSFLIEREVLYQEALRQGIKATDEEVDNEFRFYLLANNLTEPQLGIRLEAVNSSVENLKLSIKKQVMINKLFEKAIPRQFVIKQEEVRAAYERGRFASLNITFEQAEKSIVDLITAQRQATDRAAYVERLKEEADVLVVTVPS